MEHRHGPKEPRRERVHAAWREFYDVVMAETGPGRERSLALTKAEEAFMWAREAVERTE